MVLDGFELLCLHGCRKTVAVIVLVLREVTVEVLAAELSGVHGRDGIQAFRLVELARIERSHPRVSLDRRWRL